jgi:hypothetical protein
MRGVAAGKAASRMTVFEIEVFTFFFGRLCDLIVVEAGLLVVRGWDLGDTQMVVCWVRRQVGSHLTLEYFVFG